MSKNIHPRKTRRWRAPWVHARTWVVLKREINAYLVFLITHVRTLLVFVTVLVTAYLTNELSALLFEDGKHLAMAWMLSGLSHLLLLTDILFVTNLVVPWVPRVKKWIDRNQNPPARG